MLQTLTTLVKKSFIFWNSNKKYSRVLRTFSFTVLFILIQFEMIVKKIPMEIHWRFRSLLAHCNVQKVRCKWFTSAKTTSSSRNMHQHVCIIVELWLVDIIRRDHNQLTHFPTFCLLIQLIDSGVQILTWPCNLS